MYSVRGIQKLEQIAGDNIEMTNFCVYLLWLTTSDNNFLNAHCVYNLQVAVLHVYLHCHCIVSFQLFGFISLNLILCYLILSYTGKSLVSNP